MGAAPRLKGNALPLSAQAIPGDEFEIMRAENLARWPTGASVDLDEAAAFHKSLPRHKRLGWVMRQAVAEGRCLTQPRGGCATIDMQLELVRSLDRDGLADIVPTTTDSYTRNERFAQAADGIAESERLGRSVLNGFPMVNYGVAETRRLIEAIDKPAIVLSGTSMPRLTSEIGLAAGFSGYLGSGIAYTASYTKDVSIEDGIRNYQYLDRLAALYQEKGVELHRRQPGFLTGTNIPPAIAIVVCILDALLAAGQGVRNYGLELGQCLHLIQDAAAIRACGELTQEYLRGQGHNDVFTPVTSLHWMGAWPHDDAQSQALVALGGTIAAIGGAASVTTKSVHEAYGIPTPRGQCRGPAHHPHGGLPGARRAARRAARIPAREGTDRPRGAAGGGPCARHGRRRRRHRRRARRRGRGARCPLVAQPVPQKQGAAGPRRRRLPAHPGCGRGAVLQGSHGNPPGTLAPPGGARRRRLRT